MATSVKVKRDGPGWRVWVDGKPGIWPRQSDRRTALALAREVRNRYRTSFREGRA